MREGGGNCLKYLESGGGTKILKSWGGGGKLGQEVGALKRRGGGTPLRTMYNHFLLLKNYRLWH